MKNNKKDKKPSLIRNSLYCASEIFRFKKSFMIYTVIAYFVFDAIYTFESTYYMKWLVEILESRKPFSHIVILVCVFVGLQLLVLFFDQYLFVYWHSMISNRFTQYYNRKIFKKAGNVELSCYEDPDFFDKYTHALDGMPERMIKVTERSANLLSSLSSVGIFMAVMVSIEPGIALFLTFPMIGNFMLGRWLNNLEQKRYKENTKSTRIIDYVMRVMHLEQYAKEIRLTDVFSLMMGKYKRAERDICSVYDKYAVKSSVIYWLKVMFTFTLIFEGILAYCAYCALVKRTMLLSEMTIMTTLMTSAAWSIIGLFDIVNDLHKESIYIQNARDFLAYEEKIPEDSKGLDIPLHPKCIEFRSVSFSYKGCDKNALNNLSVKIPFGEKIALVGYNGAGKSTFIKLLLRLYDPDSGEILLDGINIKCYDLAQYRALFSAAFQDYQVIALSVLDNLTMGKKIKNDEETAERILKEVGLWERISTMQHGIHNSLTREFDDTGEMLSGGEKQKLCVARTLMQNRPFMIFDEPSAALDPIAEWELFSTIMEKSANHTAILISHRLSSVRTSSRICMFENGCITEEGTHESLMAEGGAYSEMFTMQAENYLAKKAGKEAYCK